MTAPLTFSSVDSKRAKAGVRGLRRNAEREAAVFALGSCEHVSYDFFAKPRATGLTALERREASILNSEQEPLMCDDRGDREGIKR